MSFRLRELAELVGARVEGDPERQIGAIRTLESAGPDDLAPYTHTRFRGSAASSRAGAFLVGADTRDVDRDRLVVERPGADLACLLRHVHPEPALLPGVHPTALVGEDCDIDESASIGAYVVIGDGCRIGGGARLHPLTVVGERCRVGAGSTLYPHVALYPDTHLGDGVVVHGGSVLGGDGFRYEFDGGKHVKVPQIGRLVIEDEVEIGANTTVDRGGLDETRIGQGTKIDNLVQVGHNVIMGRHCILVSQVGIAGSARLGNGVVLGGQAGVGDHVEVGDGVRAAGRSGLTKATSAGATVAGMPAVEAGTWWRREARVARLDKLQARVKVLERALAEIVSRLDKEDSTQESER